MKRILILAALLAAACGSVDERGECSTHVDCPAGQYCARTPDGAACWPDAVAPQVTAVSASCDGTCRRDSVLHVTATAADATTEILDAAVTLDLPGAAVPMRRSAAGWTADVELREFAFDHFERNVVATVTARDGARNASEPVAAAAVGVTRLRWVRTVDSVSGLAISAPAVLADGTVVVGGSNSKLYFIPPDGSSPIRSLTVGTGQITAAPAIGTRAIWVGSEDHSVYAVKPDGSASLADVTVSTDGAVKGSVAVLPQTTNEWGLGASAGGRVGAVSTATVPETARTTIASAYAAGPVVRADGKICAATTGASATLRCFTFDGAFSQDWTATVGVNVSAPIALDATGGVWTGSQDSKLNRTSATGVTDTIATLSGSVTDSPVVLSTGDVVVGDQSGTLTKVTPGKVVVWSKKLNADPITDEPLLSALVLTGGSAAYVLPTKAGTVYAVDSSGDVLWRHALTSGAELRSPNLHTPPGQPAASVVSTGYFAAANGRIYAVAVDGRLDDSAPWPKAFHDPRNTNRAGPQP